MRFVRPKIPNLLCVGWWVLPQMALSHIFVIPTRGAGAYGASGPSPLSCLSHGKIIPYDSIFVQVYEQQSWCAVPRLENFAYEQQKYIAIPVDSHSKSYDKCHVFDLPWDNYTDEELLNWNRQNMTSSAPQTTCNDYVFDKSVFVNSLQSEVRQPLEL